MTLERQLRWYEEHLPLKDAHVVDGGANVGLVSEFFAAADARNRVLSVEPVLENVLQIERRIESHGARERWTVRACALSNSEGEATARVGPSEALEFNSVLVDPRAVSAAQLPSLRRVRTVALHELCPDATVIKLDIEGHEYAVLDASLEKMPRARAWALELHEHPAWSLARAAERLRRAGYRLLGAGVRPSDPTGPWATAELPLGLEWSMIPAAKSADGRAVKAIHVLALR